MVSPYGRLRAGEPQGDLLAVRVWDRRKSERRAVMARIGVGTLPHGKPGRLLRGLLSHER
ncbi:hypothetical protein DENIT_12348 [Pseudomonas veronii]|uniref:Uncharacterized protein n=1 Tax=Pseudomonas haemolytica TaxID=2600065 RepID=A0A646NRN3_9PSED|nr:hypothetical protein [Pseudomonas aeruginosa]MRJ19406.1 hypothetical protein [Pseudomonas haemolytica]TQH70320.1 hypothetical protein FLI97_28605 [Pseudomonas aeruginosa]TQI40507.1 hypothetical protein FLI86_16485 [Pseudomonas aeruginosa]CAD0262370.1 hypothetical protein DENIT_12348 [Pseudomonas veronii]